MARKGDLRRQRAGTVINKVSKKQETELDKAVKSTADRLISNSFLSMALSYLEVGRVAASADSNLKDVSDYHNAIAYQLFHGMELFYKFMICSAGQNIRHIHDLGELENQYKECYPDPSYHFENPFNFSSYEASPLNPNETQLAQAHFEQFKPAYMSQHLRYPPDHRTGGYSFWNETARRSAV